MSLGVFVIQPTFLFHMNNKVHIFFEDKQLNPDLCSRDVSTAIEDRFFGHGDFWFFRRPLDVRKGDRIFLARAKNSHRKITHPDIYASGWAVSDANSFQDGMFGFSFQVDYIFDPHLIKPFSLDALSGPLREKLWKRAVDTTLDENDAACLENAFGEWLSSNRKFFHLRRYSLSAWTLYNEGCDRQFYVQMYTETKGDQIMMVYTKVSIDDEFLFVDQSFVNGTLLSLPSPEDILKSLSSVDYSLGQVTDFMEERDLETMEELVAYFNEIFLPAPRAVVQDVLEEHDIYYEILDPDEFEDEFDDQDGEWDDGDDLSVPPFLFKNKRPQN